MTVITDKEGRIFNLEQIIKELSFMVSQYEYGYPGHMMLSVAKSHVNSVLRLERTDGFDEKMLGTITAEENENKK